MNQWKHNRNNTIVSCFLIMSSRCLNHTLQNCYKFMVIRGTAGIHTQSMFFFKNPPNAEIFPHPSWSSPRTESVWVESVDRAPQEPPMCSWQSLESTAEKGHHFIFLVTSEWGLQNILEMYKILFWCFCYKKIYVDSGDLSVMSIFLETRSVL